LKSGGFPDILARDGTFGGDPSFGHEAGDKSGQIRAVQSDFCKAGLIQLRKSICRPGALKSTAEKRKYLEFSGEQIGKIPGDS